MNMSIIVNFSKTAWNFRGSTKRSKDSYSGMIRNLRLIIPLAGVQPMTCATHSTRKLCASVNITVHSGIFSYSFFLKERLQFKFIFFPKKSSLTTILYPKNECNDY